MKFVLRVIVLIGVQEESCGIQEMRRGLLRKHVRFFMTECLEREFVAIVGGIRRCPYFRVYGIITCVLSHTGEGHYPRMRNKSCISRRRGSPI